jgi:hypothetical protein
VGGEAKGKAGSRRRKTQNTKDGKREERIASEKTREKEERTFVKGNGEMQGRRTKE